MRGVYGATHTLKLLRLLLLLLFLPGELLLKITRGENFLNGNIEFVLLWN